MADVTSKLTWRGGLRVQTGWRKLHDDPVTVDSASRILTVRQSFTFDQFPRDRSGNVGFNVESRQRSKQTPRARSWNAGGGLSRPRRSTMAIPKGCPSEERVASEEAGSVEVITTPGEHQDPENCHARYPGGRHHCYATLPHVILRQHRQKTIILPYRSAIERVVNPFWIRVCLHTMRARCVDAYARVSVVCAHSAAFYDAYDTSRRPFIVFVGNLATVVARVPDQTCVWAKHLISMYVINNVRTITYLAQIYHARFHALAKADVCKQRPGLCRIPLYCDWLKCNVSCKMQNKYK